MSESPAAATPASGANEPQAEADVATTQPNDAVMADDFSDDVSELSEVNEEEFENFDVNAINIEEADIDEDALKDVKVRKRERKPGEEPRKKKKESRKDKQQQKKVKRRRGEEDDEVTGEGADASAGRGRRRKPAGEEGERRRKVREETPEEDLNEDERVRRAMEKRVQAIIKKPSARRRRPAGEDLASYMDEEINQLRDEMARAAKADADGRKEIPPIPAMHKLKLLPKVMAMMSRNGREAENAICDPENNLLESVKYFLEPLDDGSMPAYNIQRELMESLTRLPVHKETLVASGIGKVILFYTKSKKPEPNIKRMAERLLAEWTRPILKRSDDYSKRALQEVEYDPSSQIRAPGAAAPIPQDRALAIARAKAARQKALERPNPGNRARLEKAEQKTYTIVPKSNLAHLPRKRRD